MLCSQHFPRPRFLYFIHARNARLEKVQKVTLVGSQPPKCYDIVYYLFRNQCVRWRCGKNFGNSALRVRSWYLASVNFSFSKGL